MQIMEAKPVEAAHINALYRAREIISKIKRHPAASNRTWLQMFFLGYDSFDETNFPPLPNPIAAYQPISRPLPPPIRSNAGAEVHPQAQAQTGSSPFHSRVSSVQSLSGSALAKERERGERAEKERSSTPRVPPGFETSLPPTNTTTATSSGEKITHAHPEVRETYTSAPPPAQSSTLQKATPVIPVVPVVPNIPIGPRSRASTPKPTPKMATATPSVSGDASGSAKGKVVRDDNVSLGSPKPKGNPAGQAVQGAPGPVVSQPKEKEKEKEKEKDEVPTKIPAVAAAFSAAIATAPATSVPSPKDAPISKAQSKQLQKPSKIEIPAKASVGENPTANNRAPATPLMTTSTITSTSGAGIVATPPPMSPAPSTPATVGSASEASAPVSRPSVVHAQPRPRTLRVTASGPQQKGTGSGSSGTAEAGLGGPSATTEQSSSTSTPGTGTHAAHAGPKHGAHIVSRQASVSSATPLRGEYLSQSQSQSRPSTPAMSERLTSEGVSRASSPPPSASASIVGSAAERKTKNQAKKERKEKAKSQGLNKSMDAGPGGEMKHAPVPVVEEVAPIVARQKKQKKNKEKEKVETAPKGKVSDTENEEAPPQSQKEVQELSEVAAEKEEENDIDDDDAGPETPVELIGSEAEESTVQRQGKQRQEERPSFTLRNLYECLAMEAPEDRPAALQDLLDAGVSDMDRIFEDLIDSGDLSREHPWFNNVSFNGPGYRLPSDTRKGQEYLNAHGYVGNHAFGYVYLPGRERRALERGDAVGIANGGNGTDSAGNGKKGKRGEGLTQDDLLKRCLITPGGVVYRHLSAEESDKVLELEERRALYVEEFGGDVGGMQMLETPLEVDDYINLSGGMEELGRYGEKHGVVWVGGEDDGDEEDGPEDDDDAGMISDETDDLGIELNQAGMPGPWDDAAGSTTAAPGAPPNTLPPMRNQPTLQINLRALDLDALQKRVQEKQREAEVARKEIEKMEKSVAKTKREVAKWRDGILAVKV